MSYQEEFFQALMEDRVVFQKLPTGMVNVETKRGVIEDVPVLKDTYQVVIVHRIPDPE